MKEFEGVKIYAETIEQSAIDQIEAIAQSPVGKGAHIRIMPDAHAGKGCVIGTTMIYKNKLCPNLIGVDIGCGVRAYKFNIQDIDMAAVDKWANEKLVSGMNVRRAAVLADYQAHMLDGLYCYSHLKNVDRIQRSLGTLGGGNHFFELNKGEDGYIWAFVHTGSRNLGKQVADYYQNLAIEEVDERHQSLKNDMIEYLKETRQEKEIEGMLDLFVPVSKDLSYLCGPTAKEYLHDMMKVQYWAELNRAMILGDFMKEFGLEDEDILEDIESVHNYISHDGILRKGAISAKEGEQCLIPLNMRDGTLVCVGKGNEDWNNSAPHGAGRILSRAAARNSISLEAFEQSMKGIYTSSVCVETLDESPYAYKDYREIMELVEPTVEIQERLLPVYNFKATE